MEATPDPVAAERRWRVTEGVVLATVAVLGTALFWFTNLDIAAGRLFYRHGDLDPWPLAGRWLFRMLYGSAPWITGSLALAGSSLLVLGLVRRGSRHMRRYGLLVLLSVILGPGLLINGVLKDHWGRPRPRQVQEFGGTYRYVPPTLWSTTPGKSFPCGHCSVGYLYALGWWILRRRRPRLARVSLAAGLSLGTLLGLGRMASGGHFLSDVLWSGLVAFGVAHGIYHYGLRIPENERAGHPRLWRAEGRPRTLAIGLACLLGAAVIAGGILASPQFKDLGGRRQLDECSPVPVVLELILDRVDLELTLVDEQGGYIDSTGWVNGFGLPSNDIDAAWICVPAALPTLRYRLRERGWFTDVDGLLRLSVPMHAFRRILVRVAVGNVRVRRIPGGKSRGLDSSLPELDIHTRRGRVEGPSSLSCLPRVEPLIECGPVVVHFLELA